MDYGFKQKLTLPFSEAVWQIKRELLEIGLDTVMEINVRADFKDALNLEFKSYVILGVSNSKLAFKILQTEKDAGIFLPFNVAVYEEFGHVWVSAVRPSSLLCAADNPLLAEIAGEMDILLEQALLRTQAVSF